MTAAAGNARMRRLRRSIDAVDDGLVRLLAARRRLVARLGGCKRALGAPLLDPLREREVRNRVLRLGDRLGVPPATALGVVDLAIADARRLQAPEAEAFGAADVDQGAGAGRDGMLAAMDAFPFPDPDARWLQLVPPPGRLAPLLRLLPAHGQRRALERAIRPALAAPLAAGVLDDVRDRRIGIETTDLPLRWVVVRGDRIEAVEDEPEASVRGSATDLLLLAARLEDADTLFFQRRLVVTGDTELGLTARNLLDRLPWEDIPLASRIVLNRAARLARAAREAHHARRAA